jgi:hypothetical protein
MKVVRRLDLPGAPFLADRDSQIMDLAIGPFGEVPARFEACHLWTDDFVIASRPRPSFRADLDIAS